MAKLSRFEKRAIAKDEEILRILSTGRYRVLEDGTVIDTNWRLTGKEKACAVRTNVNGYSITNLSTGLDKPRQITVSVHRVVALALQPKPVGYRQVNHINGNKLDNRAANLEWTDKFQNMQHASKQGLLNIYKGEKHVNSKLTDAEVKEIKKALSKGEICRVLAEKYNVSRRAISHIRSGFSWSHIELDADE